nr:uncharacterized protein LOC116149665 [Camelus dromedarius]
MTPVETPSTHTPGIQGENRSCPELPPGLRLLWDPALPSTLTPEPGTDGEGRPQVPRLSLLQGKKTTYFSRAQRTPARTPPAPPRPQSGAGADERGRAAGRPHAPQLPPPRRAAQPLHLLRSPRHREAEAIPRAAGPAAAPAFHPYGPSRPPPSPGPGESSSAKANSGEAGEHFRPVRPGERGWSPPKSTYPKRRLRSLRARAKRCPRALPEGARNAPPEPGRLSRSGPAPAAARPGQARGRSRGRAPGRGSCARAGAAPLAPRLPAAMDPRLPASPPRHHMARPAAAAPDTGPGGNRSCPTARAPRAPPAAGGRSPRPPSPAPSVRTGGGSGPPSEEPAAHS